MINVSYMVKFNKYIKKNDIIINANKYISIIIQNNNICISNINLVNYLIELCEKKINGFCVDIIKLIQLNILHDENEFTKIIRYNKFKPNFDYIRFGGHYYLSFITFKLLMSKYNIRYMKDIFIVEEIYKYYQLIDI